LAEVWESLGDTEAGGALSVRFYGKINMLYGSDRRMRMQWVDAEEVMAMAYDYPVPDYRTRQSTTSGYGQPNPQGIQS